ncbi:MAG: phosphate signaling complex protein PhoU [Christensenellales bacterium]
MRSHFDEQLHLLNEEMIRMGSLIEQMIEQACAVMLTRDQEAARAIMQSDNLVDRKEREIETLCLRLILMQQPVARDLRLVSSALKMITDMERIGDQAADISEIISMPIKGSLYVYPEQLQRMGESAGKMVHEAIDAFVSRDLTLASEVIASDDIVDGCFTQVKQELLHTMKKHPEFGIQLLDALMIAKYLERIGDHATNIAEWVEYAVTGVYKGEKLQ